MTPDKIYINVTPLGVDYSIVPIPDFGGVEYIRKDALLEWINENKNYYSGPSWDLLKTHIETL